MAPAAAHAVEGIISPIDLDSIPPFWRRKNGILLYFLLTSSLLASAALGIDGVSQNCTSQSECFSSNKASCRLVYDKRNAGLELMARSIWASRR